MQSEPESSELEVSTIAGDRAEDLESGKGEGGPREGSEDAGEGTMELIDNTGSWDMDNLMPSVMTCSMIWSRVFSLCAAPLALISTQVAFDRWCRHH